jgi:membrane-bound lytic murein transglycosylase D
MTYTKLFTVLAVVAVSFWAKTVQADSYNRFIEETVIKDTLKPQLDTTILSPEELALLIEHIPNVPNEVIQDRLSCIESEIPLVFNNFVRSHIDYFTIRNRKYTRMMLTRHNVYFPMFEKYLKKHNMPQDLKYLAIVESGLKPTAKSHAAAVGLWQFISSTGKEYGLDQNQYIDERMDPEKSTDAALRFLRRLHNTYGDWELAMAAYNCGPGNVNKAIRKAGGGQKTFWEIFPYLPRETRSYVPSMTAVIYAMNYATEHNIFSDSILYEPQVAYFDVNKPVDLKKLSGELHMKPNELLALNPEIKNGELPDNIKNYKLRIPASRTPLLASTSDKECILLAAAPTKAPVFEPEPAKAQVMYASTKTEVPKSEKVASTEGLTLSDKITYKVQKGDNLTAIANKHNVTVEQLQEWNELNGSLIKYNQQLVIMKPAALLAMNQEPAPEPAIKKNTSKQSAVEAKVQQEQLIHQVQPGDTLWNISQRYNGITVEQIKKLNKLKTNDIKPGQQLILG